MKRNTVYLTYLSFVIVFINSCERKDTSLLDKLSFEYDKKYNNDYTNMFIIIDSVNTANILNIHVEKTLNKKEFIETYYETSLSDGSIVTLKNYNKTFNIENFISEKLIKIEGIDDNVIFDSSDDTRLSNHKYIHITFDTLDKIIKEVKTFNPQ